MRNPGFGIFQSIRIEYTRREFCRIAEVREMSRKANSRFAAVIIAGTLAVPCAASAQVGYGAQHGNSNPLASLEQAGPDTLHHGKTDDAMIKSAKAKIGDADPRVRVDGLEELRYVRASSPDATELMFRGLSDPDVRVRIK